MATQALHPGQHRNFHHLRGRYLEQFKYATVKLTEGEVVREVKNHYFDVSALREWRPMMASASVGGGRFPYELGWLHARVRDSDRLPSVEMAPYRAQGIDAMLHVYQSEEDDRSVDLSSPALRRHFELAAEMVLRTTSGAEPFAQPFNDPRMLMRAFKVGLRAEHATLVALTTTSSGRYVKMRATWVRDQFIDSAVHDWLEAVLSLVGRGAKPQ
jgi:hypothetical protein